MQYQRNFEMFHHNAHYTRCVIQKFLRVYTFVWVTKYPALLHAHDVHITTV